MSTEVVRVCSFLKSKGIIIPVDNNWLNSCVTCYKMQINTFTVNELNDFVYGQWLLADLRSIGTCVLPRELHSAKTINETYAIQLNYGVDISTSFHKQLQKLRRPESVLNMEVDADKPEAKEPSKNRALKMEITDGTLTVVAFEDKPIKSIKEILPGEKALLKGPVVVKKGCLFLKHNNITLLGGEVDTLLVPNAVENILAKGLNLPENPDPYQKVVSQQTVSTNNTITQTLPESIFNDDDDDFLIAAGDIESQINGNIKYNHQSSNATQISTINENQINSNLLDDGFEFPDDDFEMMASMALVEQSISKNSVKINENNQDIEPVPEIPILSYEGSSPLEESEIAQFALDKENYSLKQEPFPPKSYPSEIRVRGRVVKLSQKLGLKDEQWSLSAIISARGLEIEMDFSSQVLDKIFGITGKELMAKKKEVIKNPEIKSQMNKILATSQQRIKSLDSDILVKFSNFITNPVIIDVFDEK